MADQGPATTMPEVNTQLARVNLTAFPDTPELVSNTYLQLCEAVDLLRKQFAAQQVYINAMERRWNDVPHGADCNKSAHRPCDCWKAS